MSVKPRGYTDIHRALMNAETEDEKYDAIIRAIEFLYSQITEKGEQLK